MPPRPKRWLRRCGGGKQRELLSSEHPQVLDSVVVAVRTRDGLEEVVKIVREARLIGKYVRTQVKEVDHPPELHAESLGLVLCVVISDSGLGGMQLGPSEFL